ncbi:MAG: PmbA/TldA family metallopeptidase, partial [Candidatus Hodarchaeota archaeon]
MHDAIENLLGNVGAEYEEVVIRSHLLFRNSVTCRDGEIEETTAENLAGIGIRVLIDGSWGFASFSGSRESIKDLPMLLKSALLDATKISKTLSRARGLEVELAPTNPTKGKFEVSSKSKGDLSLEETMKIALDIDKEVRESSSLIKSSGVVLGTIRENRSILTLSGTKAEVHDMKSDLYVTAIAGQNGRLETHTESLGVTGSISDIFQMSAPLNFATRASNIAVRKLNARTPRAGIQISVLDPEIVGLLCHEAIGHTVEADFVLSGSITR